MTIYDGSVRVPAFVEHRVRLADNRRVMVAEYGQRSAVPIVYLHGFLGSRFEPLIAGPLGGNILALDRPAGLRLAMDALRTCALRGGFDGFRFDLAPVLARRSSTASMRRTRCCMRSRRTRC